MSKPFATIMFIPHSGHSGLVENTAEPKKRFMRRFHDQAGAQHSPSPMIADARPVMMQRTVRHQIQLFKIAHF
jgi:hypothetical protein